MSGLCLQLAPAVLPAWVTPTADAPEVLVCVKLRGHKGEHHAGYEARWGRA